MGRSRKQAEPLRIVGHYRRVDGELISINPAETNLPDRCKLALAEMATGQPHQLVQKASNS